MNAHAPFHPIIYVRGFAATQGEIEETVADPYMGFNIGSTKARQIWTGELKKFFFESPRVRLQTDYDYRDAYLDGEDLVASDRSDVMVPYKSVVIYRYYDEASEAFSDGNTPPIEHFGIGLGKLILRLREKICRNPENEVELADFRVYLVAHSMGGLVCRCFLQNPDLGKDPKFKLTPQDLDDLAAARGLVDKFFTYATPHNGIDLRIVRNVPAWASFGDVNNFNRERMASYLGLPVDSQDVSIVNGFPPERVFNLVGTNPNDYVVMKGLSAWAAGDASDGLVRIENATTHGPNPAGEDVSSPRAFVNRSHSGHYGIVNSEEGYQNMIRFLFGNVRMNGILDIDELILPQEVEDALAELTPEKRQSVKASYQFEVAVSVRGCQWQMHRRNVREHSAIRALDDLGILPNPRFALVHGPLKLQLDGEWLDLGRLQGAFRLSQSDINRAQDLRTDAQRCLTVENETSFHELAKLQSGELLIQTSYPGSGRLKLLSRLPSELEFWHFGDSDEAGFDILRVLREKSGRDFRPLHMQTGRTPFEQESLGRPTLNKWPFYH